eukprot:TRINITY_DN725_c1_g1_i1.p1 TRINITY_DN725_c1_g1~~TRINITY_DN725_c1_g1_i1.p1  ORF type:complete len:353 (+),score=144.86 TRINITY_DN725_c1_g1_i1:84-1142(+)
MVGKDGMLRGMARKIFGEVTRAPDAPPPPPPPQAEYTPPPPPPRPRPQDEAAPPPRPPPVEAVSEEVAARPMEAVSEEDAARIPKSKFSLKKTVSASNPVFVEMGEYGRLFTLKELPEKQSKGQRYDVLEVRSRLSPHLLRAAADAIKAAGGHPGMFTHDLRTGKVTNIRLDAALDNIRVAEDLWLMVFVPKDRAGAFRATLRAVLLDAAHTYLAQFANSQALVDMRHVGNNPGVEFPGMTGTHVGIEYEVKGDHSALLFALGDMLQKKGYQAGVVADDEKGYPMRPVLKILVPSSQEALLADLPQVLKASTAAVVASFKDMVTAEIKRVFADDNGEGKEGDGGAAPTASSA